MYILMQVMGKDIKWFVFCLIPFVNIIPMMDVARAFGKDTLFGVGLAFRRLLAGAWVYRSAIHRRGCGLTGRATKPIAGKARGPLWLRALSCARFARIDESFQAVLDSPTNAASAAPSILSAALAAAKDIP
jgi:hypothetical protein